MRYATVNWRLEVGIIRESKWWAAGENYGVGMGEADEARRLLRIRQMGLFDDGYRCQSALFISCCAAHRYWGQG